MGIQYNPGIVRREANEHDFGRMIGEQTIKDMLTNLHPGFHFDVGGNLDIPHPMMEKRQGVYFYGRHICSMDRGSTIPEAKVWACEPGYVDIPWVDIDKYDDAQICYVEIMPDDDEYEQAWLAFESKQDGFQIDLNGKLFHYRALRLDYTPAYVEWCGWQHTLHRILQKNIPGVTKAKMAQGLGMEPHELQFNQKIAFVFKD